jgi:hypothetical protein
MNKDHQVTSFILNNKQLIVFRDAEHLSRINLCTNEAVEYRDGAGAASFFLQTIGAEAV